MSACEWAKSLGACGKLLGYREQATSSMAAIADRERKR